MCSRAAWCKYMGCVISNEWRQWSERMYSAVNSRILHKDMVYIHLVLIIYETYKVFYMQ